MSTILDALKKVERERESPGDRLRHEPEPTGPRSRRVSTMTIVVCAVLGFGTGAGIALWRNAAPQPEQAQPQATAPAAPRIEVPGAPVDAGIAPPAKVASVPGKRAGTAPKKVPAAAPDTGPDTKARPARKTAPQIAPAAAPEIDADSALEPSPFAPATGADAGAPADTKLAAQDPSQDPSQDPALDPPFVAAVQPRPEGVKVLKKQAAVPTTTDEIGAEPFDDAELGQEGLDELGDPAVLDEESAPATPETVIDTGRSPPGAPQVTLSFLQWSADPARRFAFVSVDGGPSQRVREGDAAGAASVERITPEGVRLRHADTLFVIRPRH